MKRKFFFCIPALIAISNIIYFLPHLGIAYYAIMLLFFILMLIKGHIYISASGIILIGVCAFSILINDIPAYYHPWLRFLSFVTVGSLVGPFFYGKFMSESRINMFQTMLWLQTAIVIISAIGVVLGISRSHGINLDDSYFCGITSHSMLLAIIIGNTIIFLIYLFLANKEKNTLKQKALIFAIIILALGQQFWAGSRSAFLAMIAGTFALVLWMITDKKNKRLFLMFLTFIFLLGICSPLWLPKAEFLLNKNHGKVYTIDISSRQSNWQVHWESFKTSPIFGIGFSSSSDDGNIDTQTGHVESGSSYLTILECTGILGGLSFVLVLLTAWQSLLKLKKKSSKEAGLLLSLLIFYLIHMCAEGYIFAAGSFAFFYFWLLLGTIQAYSIQQSDLVTQKNIQSAQT